MVAFQALSGIDTSILGLIFVSLGAGVLSGFTGVGGAFIVMPALIILGFPANFAVGTSLAWVFGNSVIGALRHGRLGNVDIKLGLIMIAPSTAGVEAGVRLVNWAKAIGLAQQFVLSISVCLLLIVGTGVLWECVKRKRQLDKMLEKKEQLSSEPRTTLLSRRLQTFNLRPLLNFPKSAVTISLWVILVTGFAIGVVVGVLGVGGGFIVVPTLVYLFGIPSLLAVGTSLFQIVFSSAYGVARHAMSGNIVVLASLLMIAVSSMGVQIGVQATRSVSALSIRFVLGLATLASAVAAILKLFGVLQDREGTWTDAGSTIAIFAGIGLAVLVVLVFHIMAIRFRRRQHIPVWARTLIKNEIGK